MLRKTLKIAMLVAAVLVVATAIAFWVNLSQLSRKLAEDRVPGLHFQDLKLGWNRVDLRGFQYSLSDPLSIGVAAPAVHARPTFLSFIKPEIEISELDIPTPQFRLVRKRVAPTPRPGPAGGAPPTTTAAKPSRSAYFKQITIHGGKGELVDETVEGEPARLQLSKIYLRVKKLRYPPQAGAVYVRSSAVVGGKPDSRLAMSGWIDPVNQSTDLKINLDNLDLELLRPYFRGRVSALEKARGRASIRLDLLMVSGAYDAAGEVSLGDLRIPESEGRPGLGKVLFAEYLKLRGNRISVPFKVKGNLRTNEHQVDFSALLSSLLNREMEAAASGGGPSKEQLKALEKDLREKLREKARGLFK